MTSNSDYITQETVTGIVPVLKKERTYNFLDLFLSTSGFAIATWCYTQGAYAAQYLSFNQLLVNIFCFNIVWILIECLPIFFGVRYGIDLWIWLRSVLGKKGVTLIVTVVSIANLGWYAVDAQLFSSSMINLFNNFGVSLNEGVWKPVLGVLCVIIGTLIALGGPTVIKWTSRVLVSALLAVGVIVIILSFTSVPFSEILSIKPSVEETPLVNFMTSAEGNVAFAFSWSILVVVMPRLCKSESKGYWATSLSYGVVAPFFVFTGGVMAYAMFIKTGIFESDPTVMLSTLYGPGMALLSLLMVAFANIGTQGIGSYAVCMTVKSGYPKVSYKLLVILAMIYVSILTVWGWPMEHFGSFVSLAGYIQGPLIGITVVDYLIVKKRKLSLKSAYNLKGHDSYHFTHGFNLVGLISIVISFASCLLFIYNPITGEIKSPIFLAVTGCGYTAICGGLVYWIASLTPLKKYMLRDRNDLEIV